MFVSKTKVDLFFGKEIFLLSKYFAGNQFAHGKIILVRVFKDKKHISFEYTR